MAARIYSCGGCQPTCEMLQSHTHENGLPINKESKTSEPQLLKIQEEPWDLTKSSKCLGSSTDGAEKNTDMDGKDAALEDNADDSDEIDNHNCGESDDSQQATMKTGFLSITGLIQRRRTPMIKHYHVKQNSSCTQEIHSEDFFHCETGGVQISTFHVPTEIVQQGDEIVLPSRLGCISDQSALLTEPEDLDDQDKPFKCGVCGKGFSRLQGRTAHMKTHSEERPFQCERCHQKFRVKQNLITHVRTHTGEKPHTCEVCGRGFGQQSTLVRHLRSHTGERPYTCKYCSRKFSQRHVMVNHLRIHTGEKPYTCEECGKGFKEQHNLVRHFRTHTGEKPYVCLECGNKFTQKNHLMRHGKVHIPKKHTI
ncbi:uncharacterized protein [Diadema antillarum]|uniref:uncharacterized protein n=1 Tax=Diadema antillarum TaxID=105358 RepID=UPI003A8B140E